MSGYLETGIQTPMAQGRSTKIISIIQWIRTSRLSIKKSLSLPDLCLDALGGVVGLNDHQLQSESVRECVRVCESV
jgi:hypothetical protein